MSWRPAALTLLVLLMESLAVYAFVAWFVAAVGEGGAPSWLGVAAIVGLSFGLARALQATDLPLGLVRAWGSIFSLILFYAVIRVDFFGDWRLWDFGWANELFADVSGTIRDQVELFFGVPLLWLVWLRGLLAGQRPPVFETVLAGFGVGILLVAGAQVFQGGIDDAPAAIGWVPVPFVATGLLALALAHATRADEEAARPFDPGGLVAIGAAIVSMAGFAALASLFDLDAAADAVGAAARLGAAAAGKALFYAIWPVAYAFDFLFTAIREAIVFLFGESATERVQPEDRPRGLLTEEESERLLAWLDVFTKVVVGSLLIAVLLGVLLLLFGRWRRQRRPLHARASVYQEGRLGSDLAELLGSLFGRFRPSFGHGANLDAIRRLYHEMLDEAASRGLRRPPGTTPLEFAPQLEARFGSPLPRRITDVFDEARYGGQLPTDDEMRALRAEWQGLSR